jgi:hypothetical protein
MREGCVVLYVHRKLKEAKALSIYTADSGINHTGPIETQLRDGNSFRSKRMQDMRSILTS